MNGASATKLLSSMLLGYAAARLWPQKVEDLPSLPVPGTEEGGATGAELRYWLAKEAVRHGEILLKFQATTLADIQRQASTLLGWIITAATAAVTVAVGTDRLEFRWATISIAAGFTITAVVCIAILWPRNIRNEALEPNQVLRSPLQSELEYLESLAGGHSNEIKANNGLIVWTRKMLIAAWILFVATPVAGGLTLEAYATFRAWAPGPAHQPVAAKGESR